jgi:DNA-binding beta-propeller fold protein YncE
MTKQIWISLVVLSLVGAAFAQSNKESKNNYSITKWGQPQGDWGWTAAVASDHKNSILVIRRSDPPILVFNRDGKLVNSFGNGMFKRAHSIDVDRFGFVWATDSADNVVYKFTMEGKLLMTLGKKGVAGDNNSHDLFNGPNDVAVAPNGDIFVSDGDRNSRIVKFTKDGQFIKIIGGPPSLDAGRFGFPAGAKPTEGIVHAIAFDSKGRLLTIESSNPRIQIFDQDGKFIEQWPKLGFMKACGLAIAPDDTVYVGDTDAGNVVLLKNGKIVDTIHQNDLRPHNIDLDPSGAVFIADVGGDPNTKMIWKIAKK